MTGDRHPPTRGTSLHVAASPPADDAPPGTATGGPPAVPDQPVLSPDDGGSGSQATRLVALAQERYRVVLGSDGRPYAVDQTGPMIALSLRGRDGLRTRLATAYYDRFGSTPGGGALADALTVLEGAAGTHDPEPVGLRVAATVDGGIVLDLGTADGRCVDVDAHGWTVRDRSPVLFRRTALTAPLPIPARPGDLAALRRLVNVSDAGFRLLVGWLVAAFLPDIPHPILVLTGEQGTAKSTAARLTVCLLDPSPAPLRSAPRDVRQWSVTASASWLVALDNISTIPPWLSDTLCKAVTGDGMVDRALYTDDDVTVISYRRVLAMTAIDAGELAGDLAERILPLELTRIDPGRRRTDAEIAAAYDATRPAVLAALLDLLSQVLAALPAVRVAELPRMADFARVLAALDTVTGWSTLADYTTAAVDLAAAVLAADPVADAVRRHLGTVGAWTGTAETLYAQLPAPDPRPRTWPKSPRGLSGALRRIAPALRAQGVAVDFTRSRDIHRQRLIHLAYDSSPNQPSTPSRPSTHPQ
ncbi:ATP-binding protein [Candidatus Protofrankia californiensis]|uniref:ATP-binding protein n=1 Tax=Candidatus Protofrankia californiensis TaxID=1839754 RepID=A0A1C3NVL0_9ACTN|nr:ATP-binding protein [Candidatus Protofrankia californiensis]